MSEKNYDLLKEPLFVCYATILQIWYEDPDIENSIRHAMDNWLNDFCQQLEIDQVGHAEFLKNSSATMTKMFWHAFLQDLAIMPSTGSHDAIKAGMNTPLPRKFKPGAIRKDEEDDENSGKLVPKGA